AERAGPEEAAVGGHRRGVRRLHGGQVAQQGTAVAGVPAPQDGHQRLAARGQRPYRLLGDLLPALAAVGGRSARGGGEGAVEQQHTLLRPRGEIAGGGLRQAEVLVQFPEDVDQAARQRPHVRRDREGQPDGVPRGGVGVLSDDQDAYLVEGL